VSVDVLGKGPPIVFLHGLGQRKEAWTPQHELADSYQLIIPDLRGHGENEIQEDISKMNFVEDTLSLLDNLGIGQAIFCGISMGGIIAQEIHRQAKDRVKGLILVNTVSYIPFVFGGHELKKRVKALESRSDEEYIRDTVERCLFDKKHTEEAVKGFKIHRNTYMDAAKTCSSVNYLGMLPFVKVPTLIITGKHDVVTPPECAIQTMLSIPGSKLRILDNGHLSNLESKDTFNQLIREFI